MKVTNYQSLINMDSLKGRWPCNEGMSVTIQDISKYLSYAYVIDCHWKKETRPIPNLRISNEKNDNKNNDLIKLQKFFTRNM